MNCACEWQNGRLLQLCGAHSAFMRGILDGERQREVILEHARRKEEMADWTKKDGRSNSSDQFEVLVHHVQMLIRNNAFSLINGDVHSVARLIVSQLAHKHNCGPLGTK